MIPEQDCAKDLSSFVGSFVHDCLQFLYEDNFYMKTIFTSLILESDRRSSEDELIRVEISCNAGMDFLSIRFSCVQHTAKKKWE